MTPRPRRLALLLACWLILPTAPVWAAAVQEETVRLPVAIGGHDYTLDALVVRPPGDGRLPVALITHGASPNNPRAATLDWLRGWAHDLANRGWLAVAVMRRGYGASDGDVAETGGTCASPDVGRYLDDHADDLQAALRSIARRPDADMGRVLAIGDSAGGAAVLALAARADVPLAAAVTVSGGLSGSEPFRYGGACALYEADLVWNLARFGRTVRAPTLWLYAENDGWFRPGLVARMRAAFIGSGGPATGASAELVMLPPFGDDGHAMFFQDAGRGLLLPELDRFLRAHGLPTWDEATFAPLLARLSPHDRAGVETYLAQPTEKALAVSPGGATYWRFGERRLPDARDKALASCKEQSGAECTLAAENFGLPDQVPTHPE